MPRNQIYLAITSAIAITAASAWFVSTRDFRPIRYYMPAARGIALARTSNS